MARRFQQPNPGAAINWSHPIAHAVLPEFVCVVDNTTQLFDLVRGQLGGIGGNPTTAVVSNMQKVWVGDGSGDNATFGDRPTTMTGRDIVLAAVVQITGATSAAHRFLTTSNTTNAGFDIERIGDSQGGDLAFTKGGVVLIDSNLTMPVNVPHFVAASYRDSDGQIEFVVRRLDTGALLTASTTNTQTPSNGDGVWTVGGSSVFTSNMWSGDIAFAAIGKKYVPVDTLVQWASDPYCFLRRQIQPRIFFVAAAPAAGGLARMVFLTGDI